MSPYTIALLGGGFIISLMFPSVIFFICRILKLILTLFVPFLIIAGFSTSMFFAHPAIRHEMGWDNKASINNNVIAPDTNVVKKTKRNAAKH